MTNLKTTILNTVKNNKVHMIPKWKFLLYSTLGIVGVAFIFLVAVFIFSFFLFLLSRYGIMYMPFFELMATIKSLTFIPIILVVCTLFLLVLIEIMTRYYEFSFKRPLVVTLLIIMGSVFAVSYVVSETSMHDYVGRYAKERHIAMMERMYDRPVPLVTKNGMNVLRGVVESVEGVTTTVRLFDGALVTSYASTTSKGRVVIFKEGDDVLLFGTFTGDTFEVVRIKYVPRTPLGGDLRTMHGMGMGPKMMHGSDNQGNFPVVK